MSTVASRGGVRRDQRGGSRPRVRRGPWAWRWCGAGDGHVERDDRGLGGQKGRSSELSSLGTARSWGQQEAGRGDVTFDRPALSLGS